VRLIDLSFLSNAKATARDQRIALAVVALSAVMFLAVVPFARVELPNVPAFIAGYQTALSLNELITAVLLFSQFVQLRSRALLALASGYLFTALIAVSHLLSFPGLFSPTGLLGAGMQTTAWLYMFWHGGFPIFVMAYTVLARRDDETGRQVEDVRASAYAGIAAVGLIVSAATLLATVGGGHLPEIMEGNGYTPAMRVVISVVLLSSAAALIASWRKRPRSVLDVWLQVTLSAWLFDIALSAVFNSGRYDLGFYAGRIYGLCAASFVLSALLLETVGLYANLARTQDQLNRAQKLAAIGRLTGGIAHHFNNLLTALMANLEMLEREGQPPARQRRFIDGAQKAARRGAELAEQLLAFGRQQMLQPEALNINRALAEAEADLRSTLGRGIQLSMQLDPSLGQCVIDRAQFHSALTHLVLNARDAMPTGGHLLIKTRSEEHLSDDRSQADEWTPGRYVAVAVTDDGSGMPAEVSERAFEPFFTTKDVGRGSGLGLSHVYGFVKQSGGHAIIKSEPRRGTTVTMYLPETEEKSRAAQRGGAADETPQKMPTRTVLVVDDDDDVRRGVIDLFVSNGYRVLSASDGRAAIAILGGSEPIDLVFTDIVMPHGVSGLDVAREAARLRSGIKVLLTSGFADATLVAQVTNANLLVFSKPYRPRELADTVRGMLAS
jgi:signal transduction histidine kinase/CheY-like chemotaxis protein